MSDLLPFNAFPAERALALATARLGEVPMPIATLHDPETCPSALLPWLAWAESVDEWDPAWSEAQKRAVIAASREVHERKGTAGALKLAIAALGLDLTIEEWFEFDPVGDPYTFRATLVVDQEPIATPAAFARIERVAISTKNLRSHISALNVLGLTAGTALAGAVVCSGDTITLAAEPAA